MKVRVIIVLLLIPVLVMGKAKKTTPTVAMSPEEEAQFAYYFYAAKGAIENNQFDRALMLLRFCEQINPNDGATKDYLGLIYEALGKPVQADAYYRDAYYANPQDLWKHYASALMQRTDTLSGKEHQTTIKQATRIVEQATKDNPKDTERWEYLRKIYLHTQRYKQAIRVQDRIDAIEGYDAYSALNRYQTYVMWHKPKQAIAAIDDYLEEDPTNLHFLLFKVELLDYTNAPLEQRIQMYQKILEIDPRNLGILNNYAYLLATHNGDLKEAERMSRITIQEQPENPTFLDTYAWILHLQGQDMLAEFYIRKALNNVQNDSDKQVIQQHYEVIHH